MGRTAKKAPMGQRNWQKNLLCRHMPVMTASRLRIPIRLPLSGSRRAVSLEKTSQALVPCRTPAAPKAVSTITKTRLMYFSF